MESRLAINSPAQQSDFEASPEVGVSSANINNNYTTWEETTMTNLFNFKWKPFSQGISYERLSKFGFK